MLPFRVSLNNHHPTKSVPRAWLMRRLSRICRGAWNVEIDFVDDVLISKLNSVHLGKNRPTDVLAFDLSEKKIRMGEVVISVNTAEKQARERRVPLRAELLVLCIHGLLHLAGEGDEGAESIRNMKQREITFLLKTLENI